MKQEEWKLTPDFYKGESRKNIVRRLIDSENYGDELYDENEELKKEVIELKGIINYLEGNYEKLINNYIKMRK